MKKNIIIFGATGGTGQQLVKQALERNFNVSAFVRNTNKLDIKNERLRVIGGNVLEYKDVVSAIKSHDVVFCCIGMPASDKSGLRAKGTTQIVKAMKESGIMRLVCQSTLGFGDSKNMLPWHMKYIIVPLILKNAFADHDNQEKIIEKSNLDWTIVRPGNLTDGIRTGEYKHGFDYTEKIKLKVSRADVADFMLNQVDNQKYFREKVGISY
jgi:putative NADH-flavin reductase